MRIAVIGYGVMGRNHKRVLEQLGHQVVTVDPAGHADLTDISRVKADGAVLSVPAERVAEYRGLDIPVLLIEKPGALGADDLGSWPHDTPMGYVERHNPAVIALKRHLDLVGDVIHVNARRLGLSGRGDLDPILDLATHDIDTLQFLGLRIGKIAWDVHCPGHALGVSIFASLQVSHVHPRKVRTLEILGHRGVLQLDYQRQILDFVDTNGVHAVPVRYEEPLVRMWKAILAGKQTARVADGIEALKLGCDELPSVPNLVLAA